MYEILHEIKKTICLHHLIFYQFSVTTYEINDNLEIPVLNVFMTVVIDIKYATNFIEKISLKS